MTNPATDSIREAKEGLKQVAAILDDATPEFEAVQGALVVIDDLAAMVNACRGQVPADRIREAIAVIINDGHGDPKHDRSSAAGLSWAFALKKADAILALPDLAALIGQGEGDAAAIDVKQERAAFGTWWRMWCPDRDVPAPSSHIFDAWLARARSIPAPPPPEKNAAGGGVPANVVDDQGISDAGCNAMLLDGYARDCARKGWRLTADALRRSAAFVRGFDVLTAPATPTLDPAPNVQALVEAGGALSEAVDILERLPFGDWPGKMYSGKVAAASGLIRRLRAAFATIQAASGEAIPAAGDRASGGEEG